MTWPRESVGHGAQLAAVVPLRRRVGVVGEAGHVAHVRARAVDGRDPPQGRVGHGDGGAGRHPVSDAGPGHGQHVAVRVVGVRRDRAFRVRDLADLLGGRVLVARARVPAAGVAGRAGERPDPRHAAGGVELVGGGHVHGVGDCAGQRRRVTDGDRVLAAIDENPRIK